MVRLLVALALALTIAVPAGAQTEWEPVLNTERVYAHCGDNPYATATDSARYSWDTTAPAESFTSGAGCGQVDVSYVEGDEPVFAGTYTGNLDTLTVHAWVIDVGLSRTGVFEDVWTQMRLIVDGNEVASAEDLRIVPQPSESGVSRLLEFSVTNLGLTGEEDAAEHRLELHLGSMPYDDGDNIGWVLDAVEIDSGLTFNPERLAQVRVRA